VDENYFGRIFTLALVDLVKLKSGLAERTNVHDPALAFD